MEVNSKNISKIMLNDLRYKKHHKFTLPNFYYNPTTEMDIMSVTRSGLICEYEIKISRSDFKADFKKVGKHSMLKVNKYWANRFYYVCPSGLIAVGEIPDYAGLIYVDTISKKIKIIKQAPYKNKEQLWETFKDKILVKSYWRYVNAMSKISRLESNKKPYKGRKKLIV